ncbi:hypothetical protein [uncultured Desulfobacter sp.]|uniref:HPP family protein n=1 Tax=uncultured Desulfobacter sp. TaxID=240139 RepID=UPI002AA7B8DB|nr:hypothetical protein [uncultured Desulfobacter sp.]
MIPFFKKMAGGGQRPPKANSSEILWSWAGAFLGITPVAYLNYNLLSGSDFVYIIGSFGASAVLVYGAVLRKYSYFLKSLTNLYTPAKLES